MIDQNEIITGMVSLALLRIINEGKFQSITKEELNRQLEEEKSKLFNEVHGKRFMAFLELLTWFDLIQIEVRGIEVKGNESPILVTLNQTYFDQMTNKFVLPVDISDILSRSKADKN